MKEKSLLLFMMAAVAEIFSALFEMHTLHLVAKPLIVLFLVIYYVMNAERITKPFVAALIFCWMGDVLLMFESVHPLFFIFGLGSFLVAHLFFIASYRQMCSANERTAGPTLARLSFPIIMAGSGLVVILYPKLGDLQIPVMVYALVITLMVLQSVFRMGRTTSLSFWLIFFGAVSFLLSDSLLAINKFYQPIPFSAVWVMTTYSAAVFLIVRGALAHRP
jgi:uncharacterized membrane protein YhhN